MKLRDLEINLQIFKNFFSLKADISIEKNPEIFVPKDRLFQADQAGTKVPASDFPGVFVYLLEKKVIYVGNSEKKLGERVLCHLGAPNWDDKTFPYHRWSAVNHPDPNQAEDFRAACASIKEGKIGIVTIVVKPGYFAPALKSFLLSRKEKPLLNF